MGDQDLREASRHIQQQVQHLERRRGARADQRSLNSHFSKSSGIITSGKEKTTCIRLLNVTLYLRKLEIGWQQTSLYTLLQYRLKIYNNKTTPINDSQGQSTCCSLAPVSRRTAAARDTSNHADVPQSSRTRGAYEPICNKCARSTNQHEPAAWPRMHPLLSVPYATRPPGRIPVW